MPCNPRATRGYGLLEGLLARQRMRRAEKLIDPVHRAGRLLDFGCGRFPLFLSRARFHDKYGLDQHIDESARFEGLDTNVTLKRFDIDKQDLEGLLRPGATAKARVMCGTAPLGYVLLMDALSWIEMNIFFRLGL